MRITYIVACDCRKQIRVTSSAAGTTVNCACGAEVKVPGLSQLRQSQGQESYASNTLDVIADAHHNGREPAGLECLYCGGLAEQVVDLKILCERSEMNLNSLMWLLVVLVPLLLAIALAVIFGLMQLPFALVFGLIVGATVLVSTVVLIAMLTIGLIRTRRRNKVLEHTSSKNLRTFFRMCERCLPNPHMPPSRRKIRRMLKQIPVYEQLYKGNKEAYTKFLKVRPADPYTPMAIDD